MYKKTNIFLGMLFTLLLGIVSVSQYMLWGGTLEAANNFDLAGRTAAVDSVLYIGSGQIGLKRTDDRIIILINGEVGVVEKTEGDVSIYRVHDGDVLQADLRGSGREGVIYVSCTSEDISFPRSGSKYYLTGGISPLFTVKIER